IDTHNKKIKVERIEIPPKAKYALLYLQYNESNTPLPDIQVEKGNKATAISPANEIGGINLLPDSFEPIIARSSLIRVNLIKPIRKGTPFSFQTDYRVLKGSPSRLEFKFRSEGGDYVTGGNFQSVINSQTGNVKLEGLVMGADIHQVIFYSGDQTGNDYKDIDVEYVNFQLERGTQATDWSPAPEDMATSETVSKLESRVNTAEQKITSDAIISTVTESTKYRDDFSSIKANVDNIKYGVRNLRTISNTDTSADAFRTRHTYFLRKTPSSGNPWLRVADDIFEDDTYYVVTFKSRKLSGDVKLIGGHAAVAENSTTEI